VCLSVECKKGDDGVVFSIRIIIIVIVINIIVIIIVIVVAVVIVIIIIIIIIIDMLKTRGSSNAANDNDELHAERKCPHERDQTTLAKKQINALQTILVNDHLFVRRRQAA